MQFYLGKGAQKVIKPKQFRLLSNFLMLTRVSIYSPTRWILGVASISDAYKGDDDIADQANCHRHCWQNKPQCSRPVRFVGANILGGKQIRRHCYGERILILKRHWNLFIITCCCSGLESATDQSGLLFVNDKKFRHNKKWELNVFFFKESYVANISSERSKKFKEKIRIFVVCTSFLFLLLIYENKSANRKKIDSMREWTQSVWSLQRICFDEYIHSCARKRENAWSELLTWLHWCFMSIFWRAYQLRLKVISEN